MHVFSTLWLLVSLRGLRLGPHVCVGVGPSGKLKTRHSQSQI